MIAGPASIPFNLRPTQMEELADINDIYMERERESYALRTSFCIHGISKTSGPPRLFPANILRQRTDTTASIKLHKVTTVKMHLKKKKKDTPLFIVVRLKKQGGLFIINQEIWMNEAKRFSGESQPSRVISCRPDIRFHEQFTIYAGEKK